MFFPGTLPLSCFIELGEVLSDLGVQETDDQALQMRLAEYGASHVYVQSRVCCLIVAVRAFYECLENPLKQLQLLVDQLQTFLEKVDRAHRLDVAHHCRSSPMPNLQSRNFKKQNTHIWLLPPPLGNLTTDNRPTASKSMKWQKRKYRPRRKARQCHGCSRATTCSVTCSVTVCGPGRCLIGGKMTLL